jgi:hypothetical protein
MSLPRSSRSDIQAHLRHSKADTTANEHMQELPESVGRMVESMYEELTHNQAAASADLLSNATNEDGSPAAMSCGCDLPRQQEKVRFVGS